MQTRSWTYLHTLLILVIVLSPETVFAQDSSHRSKPAGTPAVTDYVSLMLTLPKEETSPEVKAVMGEFFAFIRRECAAIAVANGTQLEEETRWLDRIQREAATKYESAKKYFTGPAPPPLKRIIEVEEAQIGIDGQLLAQAPMRRLVEVLAPARMTAATVGPKQRPQGLCAAALLE